MKISKRQLRKLIQEEKSRILNENRSVGLLPGHGFGHNRHQPDFARAYHGSYVENPASLAMKRNQRRPKVKEATYFAAGDLEPAVKEVLSIIRSMDPMERNNEIYAIIDQLEDLARRG